MDLNADLAEGFGRWALTDDDALLETVTSANVACGFHAGDPLTLQRVCRSAAERGVAVGAQVSYRDLAGFGRYEMDIPAEPLRADLVYQIGALQAFARMAGEPVRYLKPHGALYHRAARDEVQAEAVVAACRDTGIETLVCAPGSVLAQAASEYLRVVPEVFADRAYQSDGRLVPRTRPGAVLGPDEAVAQALSLARGEVRTVDGETLAVAGETLCVHGDTPGAAATARRIRTELEQHDIAVEPFS
ncbi:LamB/YcsF family protein [Salininema proteolyticum]|uniref:LamB/YcsF family protein n=1 Tax=Salininema proteolyticum TaxID=1607685 RepID=A0ABV8TW36_9ACTN